MCLFSYDFEWWKEVEEGSAHSWFGKDNTLMKKMCWGQKLRRALRLNEGVNNAQIFFIRSPIHKEEIISLGVLSYVLLYLEYA